MAYFDDGLEKYVYDHDGLQFLLEKEPTAEDLEHYQQLAIAYHDQLPALIAFMLPDLEAIYGPHSLEEVAQKLGRPQIHDEFGRISYLEHSFDETHIFDLEYRGDSFTDLFVFGIDG